MRTLRSDFISGLLGMVEAGGVFCSLFYEGHIKTETLKDKHCEDLCVPAAHEDQNKNLLREFYDGFRHDCLLGTRKMMTVCTKTNRKGKTHENIFSK